MKSPVDKQIIKRQRKDKRLKVTVTLFGGLVLFTLVLLIFHLILNIFHISIATIYIYMKLEQGKEKKLHIRGFQIKQFVVELIGCMKKSSVL